MEKLYVSDEAIQKYGMAYFRGMEEDDFKYEADSELKELEDGLLMCRDDMENIYLSANEYDEVFNDIEDIKSQIELSYLAQFFNMKKICEVAGISYDTYKGWKNKGFGMSNSKVQKLIETMKEIAQ